jgi:hypothetical protein
VAVGTATLDFGTIGSGGAPEASVAVTGQTGILGTSKIEAWLKHVDTAEHTVDELDAEELEVWADESSIVAGTGFTVRGRPRHGRAYGRFDVNWVWS